MRAGSRGRRALWQARQEGGRDGLHLMAPHARHQALPLQWTQTAKDKSRLATTQVSLHTPRPAVLFGRFNSPSQFSVQLLARQGGPHEHHVSCALTRPWVAHLLALTTASRPGILGMAEACLGTGSCWRRAPHCPGKRKGWDSAKLEYAHPLQSQKEQRYYLIHPDPYKPHRG